MFSGGGASSGFDTQSTWTIDPPAHGAGGRCTRKIDQSKKYYMDQVANQPAGTTKAAFKASIKIFVCPSNNTSRAGRPGWTWTGYGISDYMPIVYTDIDTTERLPLEGDAASKP